MFTKNNLLKIGVNSIIGLLAVILWLYFVDLTDIIFRLRQANLLYLIPASICLILSLALRTYKLKFFLSPIRKIKFYELLALNGVAGMLNFLIPIRAGEVTKGFYLSKTYSIDLSKAVMWVFVDRFLDFLYVLIVAPIVLLFVVNSVPSGVTTISVILAGVLLALVYLMVYQVSIAERLLQMCTQLLIFKLPKKYFASLYRHSLDTFSVLNRSILDWIILILLTTLAFLLDGLSYYFVFLSINSNQNILNMFLGQLLVALSYIIPAAPGYVGSAEASVLLVFSGILGIDKVSSSTMAILFHSLILVFLVTGGVFGIYSLNLDFKAIFKRKVTN